MNYDPIIYGKDNTENITNIAHKDDQIWLFKENDGKLSVDIRDASYWIVRNNQSRKHPWQQLEGGTHYNFLKEYKYRNAFLGDRQKLEVLILISTLFMIRLRLFKFDMD